MSLYENGNGGNMVMPVGPMYGNGGCNGGFGWGDGSFWIIVLFLFAIMGNNGFGGWGGAGNGGMMPYIMNNNTGSEVQRGFDQQAVMGGINGVNAGINSLAQSQCTGFANMATAMNSGFAGVNSNMTNGFYNAETAANARQMADMQQAWAAQTAIDSRLDSMAMTQQQCCCDNKAAVADLKYTMANESAATRANCDANQKAIMDKLCQLEMDGMRQNYENRIAAMQNQIDGLRTQVSDARFDASQNAQTAAIGAGQRALANEVEQYVLPTPRPAYVVQNPNCCAPNYGWGGCGCGCGAMA